MRVAKAAKPHAAHCGAKTRAGGTCSFVAGYRTDHVGEGRCYLHGGATPIKHGRYSSITRESLRQLIEQHETDPDPLNILPELAASRALFVDFIQRYDEWRDALVAWHATYRLGTRPLDPARIQVLTDVIDRYEALVAEEEIDADLEILESVRDTIAALGSGDRGKPLQILDVSDAYRIVSEITQIVARIEKIRAQNAVSRAELLRIMSEQWRVVEMYVTDPKVRLGIRDGWLGIRL